MTTIPLNWTKPPMTKNKVRRMHHHAEAKLRREVVEQARWTIRATTAAERTGWTR